MKVTMIAVILLVGILLTAGCACGGSSSQPTPSPIASTTPTLLPIVVMSCTDAEYDIQDAISDYYNDYDEWPTSNGEPGDIEWTKLVPDFMAAVPSNDSKCDWWVNSDPEGEVCLLNQC
jgi:hypothetical protein